MKPTPLQYFFARDWPRKIWMVAAPLYIVFFIVRECHPTFSLFMDWQAVFWLFCVALLALPIGFFLAILMGWFILGPLYFDRGLKNGGPFRPGDRVRILTGPHRDRIVVVYSLWQGDSVRVELSEEEKKNYKDVFSPVQLLRSRDSNQEIPT